MAVGINVQPAARIGGLKLSVRHGALSLSADLSGQEKRGRGSFVESDNNPKYSILPDPIPVTLSITLNPDGMVSLKGPLSDRPLCYALLGMARDAIFEQNQRITNLVKPNGHGIMNFVSRIK